MRSRRPCWPGRAWGSCSLRDRRGRRSRPTSGSTARRRSRMRARSRPPGAGSRPSSWRNPPPPRRGRARCRRRRPAGGRRGRCAGSRPRYCGDVLLVYLAPEALKGTGNDHRAVHAAPQAYGDGRKPVLHWLENGRAEGGAGRAAVTLPACLSEASRGGPLPSGRAALAGEVRDPFPGHGGAGDARAPRGALSRRHPRRRPHPDPRGRAGA